MLTDSEAFQGFSTNDVEASRRFYADTLGLPVTEENGMLTVHFAGGGTVRIYPKDDHQPATYTTLNFPVHSIDATVDELTAKGVEFERYADLAQDERGIMRQWGPPIAWFKDPAGNILSVIETGAGSG